jgi:uncharacterized protein YdeI (YjbR/CyaY-like superfamily)
MSVIEDSRKLFQDMVAPDLKALGVRLDAVVARLDKLEGSQKESFAVTEKRMNDGFAAAERLADARYDKLQVMIELNEKVAAARHELLTTRLEQALSAFHNALQFDRRMEQVEKTTSAITRSLSQGSEATELPKPA